MAPVRKRGANKTMAKGELRFGDLVLAKVKGFPAWPAKIGRPEDWDHVPDPKKYFVQFFGTQEIAFVTPPDIQAFTSEAKKKLSQRCQGKTVKYFAQAVEEISIAFEELQNHKSNTSGSETLSNAAAPSLTKTKILDGTDHREGCNAADYNKFDSRVDPCLHKSVKNDCLETKSVLGAEGTSQFLKSNNRTRSPSSEPVEQGDPFSKVVDFDEKFNGVTCIEHRDGAGKNSANVRSITKKIAGDLDKRCKDEVHKAKLVPDSRAATDNHFLGSNHKLKGSKKEQAHVSKRESSENKTVSDLDIATSKKVKDLLKEESCARVSADKHEFALGTKSGILGKQKRFENDPGKSASGADKSKRPAKRPRSEDAKDQKLCQSTHLRPAGEGKAERSNSTGVITIAKHEIVLGLSARGGKIQFDKEVVAYTKRRKQTVEHTSGPSISGYLDKEGTNLREHKVSSSSAGDVKVPAAQLPKRRRLVCIYDEDDDDEDPKTPVHGGHANVPKATSASTDGPRSANASHDTSIKAKLLTGSAKSPETGKLPLYKSNKNASLALPGSLEGYSSSVGNPVTELLQKNSKPMFGSPKKSPQLVKKQVRGQNKTAEVSGTGISNRVEAPSNSLSMGKPVIKSPKNNVKQIFRSPKKSPMLFSTKDQVAELNKTAKVSGAEIPKQCHGDSFKDAMAGFDRVSSSQPQTENQRRKPAYGEKSKDTPKVATRWNDAGVSRDPSANLSAGMIDANPRNRSAPLISSRTADSSSSLKGLIAAAQAKRKQAHSHTSPSVNLDHNLCGTGEMKMKGHSPFMVQNCSSAAGDVMLVASQGHHEDPNPSNHGHQSTSSNHAETEENKERRVSSQDKSVGGSLSGDTEAAISRDAFEGMIETLSRTKESIGRATRQAIDCAKYGIASEVVELLIHKLDIEPHFHRKVDLFFLVDSIIQCSHSQKGKAGALYIPTVQAALPRLLGAAAPPGIGARDNRHQCRKVLRLWLKRKIFPDSLLRRYIGDIGSSVDDATVGFSLRRPSKSERAVDDPIRVMEGMLVDEYGSNANFQLPAFFSSYTFGDDDEDEDLPSISREVKNTHIKEPVDALGKLEAHDGLSDKPRCVVEDVNGVLETEDAFCQKPHCVVEDVNGGLEREDAFCQPRDEVPSVVCGIEAKEDSPAKTTATEVPPFPEGSSTLPDESPPSPPPLPSSPPPPSPPLPSSSPPQLLSPPPPPSEQCSPPQSIAPQLSSITQPSMASHPTLPLQPGLAPPGYPSLRHEYQISMQREESSIATSNQNVQVLANAALGWHGDEGAKSQYLAQQSSCFAPSGMCSSRPEYGNGNCFASSLIPSKQLVYGNGNLFLKHDESLQNLQLRPGNTSFLPRPMIRNLSPAPSSHFSLPSQIVQSQTQCSSFPHPYPFPSQPVDGRRLMNEEPWRMPSYGRSADTQKGAGISEGNPLPGSLAAAEGFFRPPPGTISYQLSANNLHAGPTISGHTTSQLLPSRPEIPSTAHWRPS